MGANVQPNGNCELASPAITLSGAQASRVITEPCIDGQHTILLGAIKPANETGTATWPNATVVSGETYDVQYWLRHHADPSVNPSAIRVRIDKGSGTFTTVENISQSDQSPDDLYYLRTFSFVATGTTARVRFVTLLGAELIQSQFWSIDAIRMEKRADAMAIKLAERGIAAVVSLLQSNLATELTAIDTDRADSITMDAPANADYHTYPKAEIAGSTVHVEVFEEQFETLDFYTDADHERAVYNLPVTVRVTHFNRANHSAADMVTRSRRYATGVFNVFLQTPLIDAADAAIQIGRIESASPIWVTDGEDATKIVKTQVTLTASLRCEETYS